MKKLFFGMIFMSCVAAAQAVPTAKRAPKELGSYGDWKAYVTTEDAKKVCYMTSFPQDQTGNYQKRGRPYAMITHRPAQKSTHVISVYQGYPLEDHSEVTVTFRNRKGEKAFKLFTKGEAAWARTPEEDKALSEALAASDHMIVAGKSQKGTESKDTYSLKGSRSASQAIAKECGLK